MEEMKKGSNRENSERSDKRWNLINRGSGGQSGDVDRYFQKRTKRRKEIKISPCIYKIKRYKYRENLLI